MPKSTAEEPVFFTDIASGWERAHAAFLDGKQRRSGSRRTVESYSGMLLRLLRTLGQVAEGGAQPGGLTFRPQTGTIRQCADRDHYQCPHRLPELVLQVSDPEGDGQRQAVQPAGTAADSAESRQRSLGGAGPAAPRGNQRRGGRPAQLGHRPHAVAHRTAFGGDEPDSWLTHQRCATRDVSIPGPGRKTRPARAAVAAATRRAGSKRAIPPGPLARVAGLAPMSCHGCDRGVYRRH